MLNFYRYKYYNYNSSFYFILVLLSIFVNNLYAKEPLMAILLQVKSNTTQEFKVNQNSFSCSPYGVITLEDLYKRTKADSVCRKSILAFYKKRKDLKYYVHDMLSIFQLYSLRFEDKKCILNVSGEKSLSEILLDKGLAIKEPGALQREYNFYFYKAEQKARIQKKGLWEENIYKECASSIYIDK